MQPTIILYTQPDCPPCEFIKLFFKENNIPFEEKDIKKDSRARQELTKTYQIFSTPGILIDQTIYTAAQFDEIKAVLNI
ncbi:glutaredoxin domain-containing protein [Peribacillus kribbensis]|uniref:glutaredoxin domain-containing protein n=1 Tax=Peribacillus kribbensis TaxID=356658 RepID=UPI000410DAAE|nr:glutaredoxin domain-containing protein [Peribacillus kribbensis]